MRMRNVAALAAVLLGASASVGAEETERPLSPAQTALFASDHLHAINAPTSIRYSFTASVGAGGFADSVAMGVAPRPDGTKDIRIDFFTGERHMPFQPVAGFKGNPTSTRVWSLADDDRHMTETIIRHAADGTPYTITNTWLRQ